MTTRVSIAEDDAVNDAELGMSMEGIAHAQGVSRMTLWRYRTEHPEFNARLMKALTAFERSLLETVRTSISSPDFVGCANTAKAMLAQRFPQRHGTDSKLRLSAQQAQEGYEEDLADPALNPAKDTAGAVIGRLVEEMLKRDEETP